MVNEEDLLSEEERTQRVLERRRVQLKARMLAESDIATEHAARINMAWRQLMRAAKLDEIRSDIQVLSQQHEREVDRRDAVIAMLEKDLEDAEGQYMTVFRGHMQAIDSLMDLQHLRIQDLDREFKEGIRLTAEEYEEERAEILAAHAKHKKDLLDILSAMEVDFNNQRAEADAEFEAEKTEVKNTAQEEYHVLRIQMSTQIDEAEEAYDKMYSVYLQLTDERTQQFQAMAQRDKDDAKDIEREMNRLLRLNQSVAHWRSKIATNNDDWAERNAALREEKEVMTKHYSQLKAQMDRFRRGQQARLKELSRQSGAAMDTLGERISLAERILRLADLCRKLETEQEKVLPFWSPAEALADEVLEGDLQAARAEMASSSAGAEGVEDWAVGPSGGLMTTKLEGMEGPGIGLGRRDAGDVTQLAPKEEWAAAGLDANGEVVASWAYLDNFFKKYNKVLLDVSSIRRERSRLEEENEELRRILKSYLDGISVTEDVISNPVNSLLIVNERLQRALRTRATAYRTAAGPPAAGEASVAPAAEKEVVEVVVPAN